ncbi:MAG: serine/threonine-protein kinase [Myxococcales bacterium]|nr:serine/threonine protein kinase [Polyangiaceae bacterium]MDW8249846.1 serine/threonine-protein kinase [Myxococcales bacterium]
MGILPGTIIAERYEVIRSLGRGGVGEVYESRHLQTGLIFALKLLHPYVRQDEAIYKRFLREARAVGMLSSPYVARMIDMVEDEQHGPTIIFELLVGETLHERLRRTGKMDLLSVDTLVRESLRGLKDAHAAGIIHRDLKPANIFLQQRAGAPFQVKLLDFGISKLAEMIVTPLTKPQQSLGSLAFMPPEQFERAAEVDGRADLYALGTVVFQALTGELPYSSTTLSEMLTSKRSEVARSLQEVTGLPFDPQVEAWVARMLARDPGQRYPSAGDALVAWQALPIVPEGLPAGPSSRPPPSGTRGSGVPTAGVT